MGGAWKVATLVMKCAIKITSVLRVVVGVSAKDAMGGKKATVTAQPPESKNYHLFHFEFLASWKRPTKQMYMFTYLCIYIHTFVCV